MDPIVSKVNGGQDYTFDRQNNLNSALLFSNTGALKINASNNSLNFGTTTVLVYRFGFRRLIKLMLTSLMGRLVHTLMV